MLHVMRNVTATATATTTPTATSSLQNAPANVTDTPRHATSSRKHLEAATRGWREPLDALERELETKAGVHDVCTLLDQNARPAIICRTPTTTFMGDLFHPVNMEQLAHVFFVMSCPQLS